VTETESTTESAVLMRSILQRIATGPEQSKNISQAEARAGMAAILAGAIDPVQAGIFLIALRMKRETDAENLGVLDAIRDFSQTTTAPVDEVIDIAEPYNGFNRTLPASPFLPAVLAALGAPTVIHGVETVGPKFGITPRQILRVAGVPVDLAVATAAARLADPACGWSYVDQQAFCPALHRLIELRNLIVKRPAITTVETEIGPLRGRLRTHLITGYVHTPYPRIYALLARHAGFASTLIVRGVEGGVTPSLRQNGKAFYYHDFGPEQALEIAPAELGIEQSVRAAVWPKDSDGAPLASAAVAQLAAEAGLAALTGEPGVARDSLIYSAALCLWQAQRYSSLAEAAAAARAVLDDGRALARFRAAGMG